MSDISKHVHVLNTIQKAKIPLFGSMTNSSLLVHKNKTATVYLTVLQLVLQNARENKHAAHWNKSKGGKGKRGRKGFFLDIPSTVSQTRSAPKVPSFSLRPRKNRRRSTYMRGYIIYGIWLLLPIKKQRENRIYRVVALHILGKIWDDTIYFAADTYNRYYTRDFKGHPFQSNTFNCQISSSTASKPYNSCLYCRWLLEQMLVQSCSHSRFPNIFKITGRNTI